MKLATSLAILSLVLPAGIGFAQDGEFRKAAARGKNPIIVVGGKEDPEPAHPNPDLLFFKDGKIVEAWELSIEGVVVSYKAQGADGKLYPRERRKHEIVSVQFDRSLQDFIADQKAAREPSRPIVAPSKLQPVQQEEILAGSFHARQGRFTRWSFVFTSQLNRYYPHARNATEYGTFVLKSHMLQPVPGGELHENEVIAKGQYFLYAPGVLGNKSWVLNLTGVSYTENDIAPRQSVYTERLPDEVFILNLSKDENVFSLEWANHEGWQWTSPTQQTFYRARRRAPARPGGLTVPVAQASAPAASQKDVSSQDSEK